MATKTTTFFLLICITLLPPLGHGTTTASGDTETVDNNLTPGGIGSFLPKRKNPPFFFRYFFRFPRYHFPLTRGPYYGYSSSPLVPRPPSSPPPQSPPPSIPPPPSLPPQTNPPPSPSPSPSGNSRTQGSVPGGTTPGSGVTPPKGLHPRLFPWWSRPRYFPKNPYFFHPRLPWPMFHIPNLPSMQNNPPPQNP